MDSDKTYKIFLSFAFEAQEKVNEIRKMLHTPPEVEVFNATKDMTWGQRLELIFKMIPECDLFLLYWDVNSSRSHWVHQEIGAARSHNLKLAPILTDKTALHDNLRDFVRFDARGDKEKCHNDLKAHVRDEAEKKHTDNFDEAGLSHNHCFVGRKEKLKEFDSGDTIPILNVS